MKAILFFSFVLWAGFTSANFVYANDEIHQSQVRRGEYLVRMIGCGDCHTPMKMGPQGPEPDMSRMLSGHPEYFMIKEAPKVPEGPWGMIMAMTGTAFAGPWGVSFAANLTPDKETGLGDWTAQMFIDTIRSGRHWGNGRPILPPMPWPAFMNATDEDLNAIFAYLQTIPALKNHVPEPLEPSSAH